MSPSRSAVAVILLIVATNVACRKKVAAVADCRNIEKYESDLGALNIPQFGLGDVIELDTVRKVGARIITVVPTPDDIVLTTPIDTSSLATNTNFAVTFDAQVPAVVETSVKTEVNSNTVFWLINHRRQNLADPVAPINRVDSVRNELVARLQDTSRQKVLIAITGLARADQILFKLKNATDIRANVQILRLGKYEASVRYSCEGNLKQVARQGGIFFKFVQLTLLSPGAQRVAATTPTIQLKDYNLVPTH